MEVVVTTGAYKMCKAPVKLSPPTKQHLVILQAGCPSCHPTNRVKALKRNFSSLLTKYISPQIQTYHPDIVNSM